MPSTVIEAPQVYCTFLGDWTSAKNQTRATRINRFAVDLLNGDYMKLLAQYGCGTCENPVNHVFISSSDHILSRADIDAVLRTATNAALLQPTDPSDIFLLIVDETTGMNGTFGTDHILMCEPTNDSDFGFHFRFSTTDGNSFFYAVAPEPVDGSGDLSERRAGTLSAPSDVSGSTSWLNADPHGFPITDGPFRIDEATDAASNAQSDPPPGLRLQLLGDWRLVREGAPTRFLRRERQLIALLALQGPRPRGYIGGTLWPDVTDAKARASLRQAISGIRHRLPDALLVGTESLSLAADVQVDALVLRHWCARITNGSLRLTARKGLEALQALAGPELLLGEFDDWVLVEREILQRERLLALEILASELGRPGDPGEMRYAIAACQAAADIEPLGESPARALMSLHLRMGNRVDALRTYEAFCKRLHDELRADPSPQMTALLGL
jgi:DNA-binding SARP family transcriptional activator